MKGETMRKQRKPRKMRPAKSRRRALMDSALDSMEEEDRDEVPESALGAGKK